MKLISYIRNVPWFLVIFIVCLYKFYGYEPMRKFSQLMTFASIIMYIYILYVGRNARFKVFRNERYLLYSLLCTLLVSILYWNLNIFNALGRYLLPASIAIIFYMRSIGLKGDSVEKAMVILTFIYLFCWLYQVYAFPEKIFSDHESDIDMSRGFMRFYIATKENLPFLLFYFFSLFNIRKRWLYLLLGFFVYVIVILHVVRQMIVWSGLVAIIYMIYVNRSNRKYILSFSIVLTLFALFFLIDNKVVQQLVSFSEDSRDTINSFDTSNIRVEAMKSLLENYSTNILTILFGNGFPTTSKDALFFHEASFRNLGYYLSDVGFVGMYCNTGLVSVLLYVVLLYQVFRIHLLHQRYVYLKFYIAYLVLSYLGSHALTSSLPFFVMAIYILKMEEEKQKESIKRTY